MGAPVVVSALGLTTAHQLSGSGLASHPVTLYALLLLGFFSVAIASRMYGRLGEPTLAVVLLIGLGARLALVPVPPELSDDVWRYLWDGHVLVAGENPWALAPESEHLAHLRTGPFEEIWNRTAHRTVKTVYPATAMGLFSIAALTPAPFLAYKALLVVLDLAGVVLLFRLAMLWGLPSRRVLWYAWNPLVLLEGVGMGHVDVVGLLPTAGAVLLLVGAHGQARTALDSGAGVVAALAVMVKLVPLVVLGVLGQGSRRPIAFGVACALALAVLTVPIVVSVGGVPSGLVTYGISWEFNGPLYEPLWRGLHSLGAADGLKVALGRLEILLGEPEMFAAGFPYVYPQLLAKTLLAMLLVVWLVCVSRRISVLEGSVSAGSVSPGRVSADWPVSILWGLEAAFLGAILAMATVYPWYLLWLLPWSALRGSRPALLLSATVLFAYLPTVTGVDYFPWVWAAVWWPPLILWVLGSRRRVPWGRVEKERA